MFQLPIDQAGPCNPNFWVLMHQLLNNKQHVLQVVLPVKNLSQQRIMSPDYAKILVQEAMYTPKKNLDKQYKASYKFQKYITNLLKNSSALLYCLFRNQLCQLICYSDNKLTIYRAAIYLHLHF